MLLYVFVSSWITSQENAESLSTNLRVFFPKENLRMSYNSPEHRVDPAHFSWVSVVIRGILDSVCTYKGMCRSPASCPECVHPMGRTTHTEVMHNRVTHIAAWLPPLPDHWEGFLTCQRMNWLEWHSVAL